MLYYFGEDGKGMVNAAALEASALGSLPGIWLQMESPAEGRAFRKIDGRSA